MGVVERIVPTHVGTCDPIDTKIYPWIRLNRTTSEFLASNAGVPLWMRVFHAVLIRLDRYGLAHFAYGELSEITSVIDPETGEVSRSANIGAAVDRCVTEGLLTPGSNTRRMGIIMDVASVGGYEHRRIA